MINDIVDGISLALYEEFGEGYEIYTEDVEQDLNEPCFSIKPIMQSNTQRLGDRYFRGNLFCIYYFPKASIEECFDVEERLIDALEYITVNGDLLRGTGMHGETVDGVLTFILNYNLFVAKEPNVEPTMETFEQSIDVGKEDR